MVLRNTGVYKTANDQEAVIYAISKVPNAPFPVQGYTGMLYTCWDGDGVHSSRPELNLVSFVRELTPDDTQGCC